MQPKTIVSQGIAHSQTLDGVITSANFHTHAIVDLGSIDRHRASLVMYNKASIIKNF
jgi:hypothetical protein